MSQEMPPERPQDSERPGALRRQIARALPGLKPIEQRVASFMLSQAQTADDLLLSDVAERAHVSPATVVRTCKSLGFSGFRTFRAAWIRDNAASLGVPEDASAYAPVIRGLQMAEALLDREAIRAAARLLSDATHIFTCGVSGGAIAASLGATWLARVGCHALPINDDLLASPASFAFTPGTVIIALSYGGHNTSIFNFVERAQRSSQCAIVAFTSQPHSPLGRVAQVTIVTNPHLGTSEAPFRWSLVSLVDLANFYILTLEVAQLRQSRGGDHAGAAEQDIRRSR